MVCCIPLSLRHQTPIRPQCDRRLPRTLATSIALSQPTSKTDSFVDSSYRTSNPRAHRLRRSASYNQACRRSASYNQTCRRSASYNQTCRRSASYNQTCRTGFSVFGEPVLVTRAKRISPDPLAIHATAANYQEARARARKTAILIMACIPNRLARLEYETS